MMDTTRKPTPSFSSLPIILVVVLLGVTLYLQDDAADPEGLKARNTLVRELLDAVPRRFVSENPWVNDGTDIEIPTGQSEMLSLNGYLSRRYVRVGSSPPISATVVIIHSRDARAMTGHHPPMCFPASGWEDRSDSAGDWTVDLGHGEQVELRTYRFAMNGDLGRELTVASGFVLPGNESAGSLADAMRVVGRAKAAKLGLAQLQILFQTRVSDSDVQRYVSEILNGIPKPVFDVLHDDLEYGIMGGRKQ